MKTMDGDRKYKKKPKVSRESKRPTAVLYIRYALCISCWVVENNISENVCVCFVFNAMHRHELFNLRILFFPLCFFSRWFLPYDQTLLLFFACVHKCRVAIDVDLKKKYTMHIYFRCINDVKAQQPRIAIKSIEIVRGCTCLHSFGELCCNVCK